MESSSKGQPDPEYPPSGQPPVFTLTQHNNDNSNSNNNNNDVAPDTEKDPESPGSPWFRPGTALAQRRPTQAVVSPLPLPQDDLELGGEGVQDPEKGQICGCSKGNFIIIIFFMIVLVAAAIGGGVGGSRFAATR